MTKKLGALWLRDGKDGKKYMTGVIETLSGDVQIVVFRNDKKEAGSKQPDYNILRSEPKKPDPSTGEVAPGEEFGGIL